MRFKGHVMHKTFIIGSIFNVPLHQKNCLSGPFKEEYPHEGFDWYNFHGWLDKHDRVISSAVWWQARPFKRNTLKRLVCPDGTALVYVFYLYLASSFTVPIKNLKIWMRKHPCSRRSFHGKITVLFLNEMDWFYPHYPFISQSSHLWAHH